MTALLFLLVAAQFFALGLWGGWYLWSPTATTWCRERAERRARPRTDTWTLYFPVPPPTVAPAGALKSIPEPMIDPTWPNGDDLDEPKNS